MLELKIEILFHFLFQGWFLIPFLLTSWFMFFFHCVLPNNLLVCLMKLVFLEFCFENWFSLFVLFHLTFFCSCWFYRIFPSKEKSKQIVVVFILNYWENKTILEMMTDWPTTTTKKWRNYYHHRLFQLTTIKLSSKHFKSGCCSIQKMMKS